MRSAAKHLVLIPLAAACSIMAVANAAEVQSPKIIIDNLTGQQIPITGTVSFQADGDLRVQCRLEGGSCPSIGTGNGGSGTNPPSISSFNAAPTTITAGQNIALSWNSTGDVCYAESPTGITGWSGNALAKIASQTISGLAVGTYTFGLRCYTAGGSATATSSTVTVNAATGGEPNPQPGGAYCDEFFASGKPTAPSFTAHGFTKVTDTFASAFGISPGDFMPSSDFKWLPGNKISAAANTYLAIPFTMTSDSPSDALSSFQMTWLATQIPGASTGAVTVTVSPCAGDFRPAAAGDIYERGTCRRPFSTQGQLSVTAVNGDPGCYAPKGKLMYINIAAGDMYGTSAPSTTSCGTSNNAPIVQCGVSMRHN